nr:unnamed protein product [Digitaria exilis]
MSSPTSQQQKQGHLRSALVASSSPEAPPHPPCFLLPSVRHGLTGGRRVGEVGLGPSRTGVQRRQKVARWVGDSGRRGPAVLACGCGVPACRCRTAECGLGGWWRQ